MPSFNVTRSCILAGGLFFVLHFLDEIFINRRLLASEAEVKTFHAEPDDISPIKFVAKRSDWSVKFVPTTLDKTLDVVSKESKLKKAKLPKVAWFVSYPYSGHAITQAAVQQATQSTVASFYGGEFLSRDGIKDHRKDSVFVYEGRKSGPFRLSDQSLPDGGYILSKTYCGGGCGSCMPTIVSPSKFLAECTFASRVEPADNEDGYRVIPTKYNPSIVKKAVHLIRNPFDNVIAWFNTEAELNKVNSAMCKWDRVYTRDQAGFKEWCQHYKLDMTENEGGEDRLDERLIDMFKHVPCGGEFFRYVQWHNNALRMTSVMGIRTHFMHYEDYDTNLDKTVKELVDFLELPIVGEVSKPNTEYYRGYYSASDKKAIESLLKHLSSDVTWKLISRYMDSSADESKPSGFSVTEA